jgi:transcription initiation factor TFIID subunit 2
VPYTFTSYLDVVLTFYSCYKDYLLMDFPFESYKQVFVEPEMAVSSLSLGASMSIFSSQALFDEKVIDQVGHSLISYC